MAEDDLLYLLRRATEERRRAVEAVPPGARVAHEAMAEAYDRRARERSGDHRDGAS